MTIMDTATDAAVTVADTAASLAERAGDVAATVATGAADLASDAVDAAVGSVEKLPIGRDRSPWRRRFAGLIVIAFIVVVVMKLRQRSSGQDKSDVREHDTADTTRLQPAV